MRHSGAGGGKAGDAGGVELDAVGVPDVLAHPAQAFGVFGRGHAEFGAAIGHVVIVLGQMGVHPGAQAAGQFGRVAHQLAADRKG